MMKKEIMKKWVKALRSGEYDQTEGVLVDKNDGFCCLGVLCNLSVDDGIGEWVERDYKIEDYDHNVKKYVPKIIKKWFFKAGKKKMQDAILPEPVRQWAGMKTPEGDFKTDFWLAPNSLTQLNDHGSSFEQIADFIEKNYKKL